jgi:hypothetical protein
MSQHSMRRGNRGQTELRLHLREALEDVVGRPLLLVEGVLRVLLRHLEQSDLGSALRPHEADDLLGPLPEPLFDAGRAIGQAPHEDLVGHREELGGRVRAPTVVLRQEGRDHLFVGHLDALQAERGHVGELPVADLEQRDLGEIALPVEPEHVPASPSPP